MSGASADWTAWVEKANHDLQAVGLLSAGADTPWDIVAFHAQQAAEKYLKAFLASRGQQPPKIHDLFRLVELCAKHVPAFMELADDAVFLSPLAVFARYPGDPGQPSQTDAERGVQIARRVRDLVLACLPSNS